MVWHMVLIDRKQSLEQAVQTTGIFVRRSFDDFALPPACFGPPIRRVTLYSPARRQLESKAHATSFASPKWARSTRGCSRIARLPARSWLPSASYQGIDRAGEHSLVNLKIAARPTKSACDFWWPPTAPACARVRDLGLSTNRQWIVGMEEVFENVPLDGPPRLHCFFDHRVAPGYIAWIAEDGHTVHVGVGGYPTRFQPSAVPRRVPRLDRSVRTTSPRKLIDRRGGRIPVGGILPHLANPRGLLIGDAAGAVSPLTAGGLDPCLRLSELAAKVAWKFLTTGEAVHLAAYDGQQFRGQFLLRRACAPPIASPGETRSSKPAGACSARRRRVSAQRIFFGDGLFSARPAPATTRDPLGMRLEA